MSRILRLLKSKNVIAFLASAFLVLLGVILTVLTKTFFWIAITFLGIIFWVFFLLNRAAVKLLYRQVDPFKSRSQVRNIDCLIIGDCADITSLIPKDETYIQIAAPRRGLLSDYELIRHLHSILKEREGKIYIIYSEKNKNRSLSIFDIPFIHTITIKKYHLESISKKVNHLFFSAPVDTIRLIFCKWNRCGEIRKMEENRIDAFCGERGYQVYYVVI